MTKNNTANFVSEFNGLGSTGGARRKQRRKGRGRRRAASRSRSSYSHSHSSSSFDLNEVLSGRKSSGLTRGLSSNAVLGDLMSKMSLMPSLSKGLLNINPISALSAPLAFPSKTNLTSAFNSVFSQGVPVAPGSMTIPPPPGFDNITNDGSGVANTMNSDLYSARSQVLSLGQSDLPSAADDAAIKNITFGGSYF